MKSFEEVADKECQEFLKSNTLTEFGMPGVNKLTNSIFTQSYNTMVMYMLSYDIKTFWLKGIQNRSWIKTWLKVYAA